MKGKICKPFHKTYFQFQRLEDLCFFLNLNVVSVTNKVSNIDIEQSTSMYNMVKSFQTNFFRTRLYNICLNLLFIVQGTTSTS